MTDHAMAWPGGPDPLWEALARYLAGESSEAEAAAVRAWLAADPARSDLLQALDDRLDHLVPPTPAVDVEGALQRVHARMAEPVVLPLTPRPTTAVEPRRPSWRSTVLAIAATVVVVLGGVLVWRSLARETTIQSYATRVGRTATIRLADGTRIELGPGSRLTVAPGAERKVELAGLALFQVRHDAAHPFVVRAGGAEIRDVGTEFAVNEDPATGVDVVVTAGAVRLSSPTAVDTPVVLRAGERGTVRMNRIIAGRAPAGDADVAWTRGRLVFQDATLDRVRTDLRRWYGVQLQVPDSLLTGRHVTASFAGEPVQQVLDVIALALGARVEWHGNTAVLQAAPAGNGP